MAYSYTPAFVAYCKGAPIEEISAEFNIPIGSLKSKMRQEGWKSLADSLLDQNGPVPGNAAEALVRIEANRAKNYETATTLRDALDRTLAQLELGSLRVKKYWQHKGQIVEYDAEPSIADVLNIAVFARTVADLTYRALGDTVANGGHKADASPGTTPPTPPITIVLPDVIARPRHAHTVDIESVAIEHPPLLSVPPEA